MRVPELHFEEGSNLDPLLLHPGPILLGRDQDCDRVIRHKKVSKRHAIVERTPDGWFICDAGSTNGTFVNSASANDPLPLYHGDLVKLGGLHATFESPSNPLPHAEAPERFQRAARERTLPDQKGPLDLPSRPLSHFATTLWFVVGIALALFIYLAILAHQKRDEFGSLKAAPAAAGTA